jgi:mannose-6-phosphate isomerase-like protein (cupin superfamily)
MNENNADWRSRVRYALAAVSFMAVGAGMHAAVVAMQTPEPGGIVIEHDADVARNEPGTHNGGGQTVGYSFFRNVPSLKLVFRKRAFKPGSGVGHHVQKEDEIYYVLSGTGTMTLDGKTVDITPGTAVLTRPGSSHSLKQTGSEDLVVLINYEQQPRPATAK